MRRETIALHGGYDGDPTTGCRRSDLVRPSPIPSIAPSTVPPCSIWKPRAIATAASAIRRPTSSIAALPPSKGGVQALSVSTGQAALHYAVLNLTELGKNIVSVPQLYGTHPHPVRPSAAKPRGHGALRPERSFRRHRGADRRGHEGCLLRKRREPSRQYLRYRSLGHSCPPSTAFR